MCCVREMSNVKTMRKVDKLDSLLRQFPHGIRIAEAAGKLGISRTYVYSLLETLKLQGKAYYENGIAYPGKPKISTEQKPSEANPYSYLNEKERKLYRLEVEDLNLHKEMAQRPEDVELIKRKTEKLRQKWGIVTP